MYWVKLDLIKLLKQTKTQRHGWKAYPKHLWNTHTRRQAIIWTNAGILLIGTLGTNFGEILSEIHTFSFKKIRLKSRLRNGGHFVSASMC